MPGRSRATSSGPKPLPLHGARPVALHEDIGVARQPAERLAPGRLAQIDEGRELAAPVVHHQRAHLRQMRAR